LRIAERWASVASPAIPEPAPEKPRERIIWLRADGAELDGGDIETPAETGPAETGDFECFMAQALNSTALADLERRFPRPYVQNVRDQLIRAGLATWRGKGPNAGWELTPRGRAVALRVSKCADQ
jgi:hypothetical protein